MLTGSADSRRNADALIHAIRNLVESPDQVDVTFSLKAAGELGNCFVVAKVSGEANYEICLLWKRGDKGG